MIDNILAQVQLLFGSVGVTLSVFFSIILLTKKDKVRRNVFLAVYFLAFALRVGKSLFHQYFEISAIFRTYSIGFLFCIGPSLWLFTQYLVYPKIKNLKLEICHYGIFILLLPIIWLIPNNGSGSVVFSLFYQATIFHMLAYIVYALFWFNKNKMFMNVKADKVQDFWKWFLVTNLAIVLLYYLISLDIIDYYLGLSLSFSIAIVIFGLWSLKFRQLVTPSLKKYQSSHFSLKQSEELYQKLKIIMEKEKLFLNPSLKLADLSKQLGASSKELSQAINQISELNYAQFISKLRINEAKRLLVSPDYAHHKIATIAFECGFDSISSFNSLFKKHTAITAKDYRKTNI